MFSITTGIEVVFFPLLSIFAAAWILLPFRLKFGIVHSISLGFLFHFVHFGTADLVHEKMYKISKIRPNFTSKGNRFQSQTCSNKRQICSEKDKFDLTKSKISNSGQTRVHLYFLSTLCNGKLKYIFDIDLL